MGEIKEMKDIRGAGETDSENEPSESNSHKPRLSKLEIFVMIVQGLCTLTNGGLFLKFVALQNVVGEFFKSKPIIKVG